MLTRINNIKPRPQDGDCSSACIKRRPVSFRINPACQSADDRDPIGSQATRQVFCHSTAVGTRSPRTNNSNRQMVLGLQIATDVHKGRRIMDVGEVFRILHIGSRDQVDIGQRNTL